MEDQVPLGTALIHSQTAKIYTVNLPPKFTQRDLQSFTRVMCIEEGEITKLSLALNWH